MIRAKRVFEIAQELKEPYEYKEIDPTSIRQPYNKEEKYFRVFTFDSLNKRTDSKDTYTVFTLRVLSTFAPWVKDLSKLEIPKRQFNGFELYFGVNDETHGKLTGGMDIFRVMSTIVSISKKIIHDNDMDFMIFEAKEEKEGDTRRLNIYKKYIKEQMPEWTILEYFVNGSRKNITCKSEYEKFFASMLYLKDNPLYDNLYKGTNWQTRARF